MTWFGEPRDTVSGSVHNGAATMVLWFLVTLRLLVAKVRIPFAWAEEERRKPKTLSFFGGLNCMETGIDCNPDAKE